MKKTILGSLKAADGTVVGYIQYKNSKEVEIWVSEAYQNTSIKMNHAGDKKKKQRIINGKPVEARRKTIPISLLNDSLLNDSFVKELTLEADREQTKHQSILEQIKKIFKERQPDEEAPPLSGPIDQPPQQISVSVENTALEAEYTEPDEDAHAAKDIAPVQRGEPPPKPPLPPVDSAQEKRRLQKEAAAEAAEAAEALAAKQRTERWIAEQTKEQEGIYQNVSMVLDEAERKLKQASNNLEASTLIAFRAAGSYGMVLEVETNGKVVAKKIEIPNADNIKSFVRYPDPDDLDNKDDSDQKMILQAFIGKLISYEEFKGFLKQAGPARSPNTDAISKIMKIVKKRVEQGIAITTPSKESSNELSDEEKTLLIFNGEGGKYFPHVHSRDQSLNSYDMDYFERGSLKNHLSSETPVTERLKMISSLSDCALFMLSHNLIHNDLHAGNILVRNDGSLVIADPGKIRFIGTGKEGALFESEGRQHYLLHPDYSNHYYVGDDKAALEDRSVDTMYNDAWSEALLIGAILNPTLLDPSPPHGKGYETDVNGSDNRDELYKRNRAKVLAAIEGSSAVFNTEEIARLKRNILLLTPERIPEAISAKEMFAAIDGAIQKKGAAIEGVLLASVIGAANLDPEKDSKAELLQAINTSVITDKEFLESQFCFKLTDEMLKIDTRLSKDSSEKLLAALKGKSEAGLSSLLEEDRDVQMLVKVVKDHLKEHLKKQVLEIIQPIITERVYGQRQVLSDALTSIRNTMDAAAKRISAPIKQETPQTPPSALAFVYWRERSPSTVSKEAIQEAILAVDQTQGFSERCAAALIALEKKAKKKIKFSELQTAIQGISNPKIQAKQASIEMELEEQRKSSLSQQEIQKAIQSVFNSGGFSQGFSERCAAALIALKQREGKRLDVKDLSAVMNSMANSMADTIADQFTNVAKKQYKAKQESGELSGGESVESIKKELAKEAILSKASLIISKLKTKKMEIAAQRPKPPT